ncbi:geminin-like [Eriocheir sinensis]|uniref:geminin-like n=1 Tax=Eriocheir sinensis TaxID=95602 RepID=UPI0021C8E247|nr:geminin-like [Eriocheir sinensis]
MENRKCLRVLQPNVQSQSCLLVSTNGSLSLNTQNRGKKRKNDENLGSAKSKRKDGIYTDAHTVPKKPTKNVSAATQTDSLASTSAAAPSATTASTTPATTASTQETLDMLTCDSPPAKYWEALAEKRKEALEETLVENKELHDKNKKLESEISELKEENKLLEEMVDEAKQLAALVQSITGEESTS